MQKNEPRRARNLRIPSRIIIVGFGEEKEEDKEGEKGGKGK